MAQHSPESSGSHWWKAAVEAFVRLAPPEQNISNSARVTVYVEQQPLARDGLMAKKQTPLVEPATLSVVRKGNQITVEAATVDRTLYKALRLPSLAVVDPEAGRSFVRRVLGLLHVQRDFATGDEIFP